MITQPERDPAQPGRIRPFGELRDSGLLWLINRVVFHPHGYALALVSDGRSSEPAGWRLLGDGSEVWRFDGNEDALFERVRATFAEAAAGR